jgi:hypothetical protein
MVNGSDKLQFSPTLARVSMAAAKAKANRRASVGEPAVAPGRGIGSVQSDPMGEAKPGWEIEPIEEVAEGLE